MKIGLLSVVVAAVIGLTAQAHAGTVVYLVGLRHVYSVPALPDSHELDRQQIEEDYSAAVADAQKHYDSDMASIHDEEAKDNGNVHQDDRDQVQLNLEKDIADAADRREAALTELYPQVDYVRASHPEFRVDQDGPYKVIEVQTAPSGEFTNVVYYQPYPLYVDVCPFGWVWGRPYPFLTFGLQVNLFHSTWLSIGCPVFSPMFYGGAVFVVNAPIREGVILNRSGWIGGRPPAITAGERAVLSQNHVAAARAGYFSKGPGGKPLSSFKSPAGLSRSKYSSGGAAATSRYSHSATSASGSRYSRSGSSAAGGSSTSTSRYSHSSSSAAGAGTSTGTSRYARPGTSTSGSSASTGTSRYARTGSSTGNSTSSTSGSRYGRPGASTSGSSTSTGSSRYGRTGSSSSSGSTGTSGSKGSGGSSSSGSSSSGSSSHGSSGSSGSSSHSGGSSSDTKKKG